MKKIILLTFFFLNYSISQTITVDDTGNTPSSLVNALLGNSCIDVSNVSLSSTQSVALFNSNGSSFPLGNGIIIRNGIANYTQGPYTGTNLDSQVNSNTDSVLQSLLAAQGQTGTITDVAFLEFDFIPLSNNFSFNFLFASNEYGQWQCASFDSFVFLLTDLTNNTTSNLAVIPNTSTPVSVLNIRNSLYNPGCISVNPNLFNTYNVDNPSASPLNMRGYTNVMTASANVTPNNPYRIRIAIGDYEDFRFDSAVFLQAGSFVTTVNLGEDQTFCDGITQTLTSGLDDTLYNHVWRRNNIVLPETSNTLTVTQSGTYEVTITRPNTNCVIVDTITFSDLEVNNPPNLRVCNNNSTNYNFNLTLNNEEALSIDDATYTVFYYTSLANANSNNPIPNSQLTNFSSPGNQTIYIRLFHNIANQLCDAVYTFDLLVNPPISLAQPVDLEICSVVGSTLANLQSHFFVSNPLNTTLYNVSFHETLANAQQNTNAISLPNEYFIPSAITSLTIWVRVENVNDSTCFEVTSFDVIVFPLPVVDSIESPNVCFEYVLPPITNGNYFTQANGNGTALNAGDTLDETGVYYIFTGPDANGCTNQTTFNLFVADDYEIVEEHCGQFFIPNPELGVFYTATGGPSGSGTLLAPGTIITTNQSIFYYVEDEDGNFCFEKEFPLIIRPLPPVDDLDDVVTCQSYILQPIANGNYFNFEGTQLAPGTIIYDTQTITIISGPNEFGCYSNPTNFTVTIINNLSEQNFCGAYILPDLPNVANYYTLPGGPNTPGNTIIPELTLITTPGTYIYYIYAPTSTAPNCTENYSFQVNIFPSPPIDTINDQTVCGSFMLPVLTNGTYYQLSGGPTTENQVSFSAGQVIDLTGVNLSPGTYYIYVPTNEFGCPNEDPFTINVNPIPVVPQVSDYASCQTYSLETPSIGNYYTAPDGPYGTGTIVNATEVFSETRTFYLYYQNPNTLCFVDRPFTVYYNAIGLPTFDNVSQCGSYTLPNLTFSPPFPNQFAINYYSQPGGNPADIITPSNYTFSTPGTYTIYVYASNGDRFFACTEERSFTVTISGTPVLPNYPNIERCGTYTLPTLDTSNYNVNYYSQPNGIGLINPNQYTFATPGTYTVYVYATATNNSTCTDQESFTITIYPLLDLTINDEILCVNPVTNEPENFVTLQSGLNPSQFQVNWYLNNTLVFTGPNLTTNQPGIYTVETIKLTVDVGGNCNYNNTTVEVLTSSSAIASLIQSSDFEDIASLTVVVSGGLGSYEFSLNNGPYQSSPVFSNVRNGEHIIRIRDVYGNCDVVELETIVLKYPKFFTPNGDGVRETWNIWDMRTDFPDALISIYDRYGKLIKQFRPSTFGWDGTLNGNPLPATDYWFSVDYTSNGIMKQFRNHFSLKR